jgi:undecaprenyl-diphosphatase
LSPLNALIVGLVQGLLEWLPISSQGNLVLLMVSLLGMEPAQALSLSVYLHIGSGLAALIYFRGDVGGMICRESEPDRRLLRFLVVSTLVTGVVGLPVFILLRSASGYGEALLVLTGVALLITGLVQKGSSRSGDGSAGSLRSRDGLILGVIQGFSAIPGLSRSGVTSSALLIKGLRGEEAFRVSFLMSIPASFAAALGLAILEGAPTLEPTLILALASSFASALLTIDALLRMARRVRFWGLCLILGVIALVPPLLVLL